MSLAARFKVKWVPVPDGGHIVEDTHAMQVLKRTPTGRWYHQPHSAYYKTADEAHAIAQWLTERAAGYPVSAVLCDPFIDAPSVCLGCGRLLMPVGERGGLRCPSPYQPCVA